MLRRETEILRRVLTIRLPYVRFQAASGLWRWYYWQVDQKDARNSILEALAIP